ncbi:MAG: hypothetical protein ACE5HF_07930 [Gemmatimonadota bacterium]
MGGEEPTGVHIRLPLDSSATSGSVLKEDSFEHVAWGTCHVEEAAEQALAAGGMELLAWANPLPSMCIPADRPLRAADET